MKNSSTKISWSGTVTSVQPRIRLTRSFDEQSHTYQGYVLCLEGTLGDDARIFQVALGPAAHQKHQFRVADRVRGVGSFVADPHTELADLYKVAKLELLERGAEASPPPPPWIGVPPPLSVYRERGHRRLNARTYDARCASLCGAAEWLSR